MPTRLLAALVLPLVLLLHHPAADLLVSSQDISQVLRYEGSTGAFIDIFASGGGLSVPEGLTFGPTATSTSAAWAPSSSPTRSCATTAARGRFSTPSSRPAVAG
jgi:hypothetical protein